MADFEIRSARNFGGKKLTTPLGIKMKRELRDALKSVAAFYNSTESHVIEDILDQGLFEIIQKEGIKVQKFDYSPKSKGEPTEDPS